MGNILSICHEPLESLLRVNISRLIPVSRIAIATSVPNGTLLAPSVERQGPQGMFDFHIVLGEEACGEECPLNWLKHHRCREDCAGTPRSHINCVVDARTVLVAWHSGPLSELQSSCAQWRAY